MSTGANDSPRLLHPRLIAPGAAFLIAAFGTDLIYWKTLLGNRGFRINTAQP